MIEVAKVEMEIIHVGHRTRLIRVMAAIAGDPRESPASADNRCPGELYASPAPS